MIVLVLFVIILCIPTINVVIWFGLMMMRNWNFNKTTTLRVNFKKKKVINKYKHKKKLYSQKIIKNDRKKKINTFELYEEFELLNREFFKQFFFPLQLSLKCNYSSFSVQLLLIILIIIKKTDFMKLFSGKWCDDDLLRLTTEMYRTAKIFITRYSISVISEKIDSTGEMQNRKVSIQDRL